MKTENSNRDARKASVGDGISAGLANWNFGGDVPKTFDDHVSKSVPLYLEGHDLICDLSDFFVKADSTIYEIGCSTGTLTRKLAGHSAGKSNAKFIGIDIEPAMVEMAKQKLATTPMANVEFRADDVLTMEIEPTDLIICYYTIQFIKPSLRQEVVNKIFKHLNWGGALMLFEKVRGADARFQDMLTTLYNEYKLRRGYTPDDIIAKTRSLKGVLEPFSTQGNLDMLRRAGFQDINTVQKYLCFEGFLAIK